MDLSSYEKRDHQLLSEPEWWHEIPAWLSTDIEAFDGELQEESANSRPELAGCLCPMIEWLSQDSRDVITLVEIDKLTQHAAAKQMSSSLSEMKSQVQCGWKQLKHMLHQCYVIQLDRCGGVAECEMCDDGCTTCVIDNCKVCP
ncbi:MAG: hypothetical protein FJ244_00070 [Nitrospira sp.]|nr:hypothetical protein [Nitrospira sp.]